MHKNYILLFSLTLLFFTACKKDDIPNGIPENPASFKEVGSIDLGGTAAAEISAYDLVTKRLFVVNNETVSKVEVLDLSSFPAITKASTIDFSKVSGGANSVAVYNGFLAVALEGINRQGDGSVAIIKTSTLEEVKRITVGALPDMVTFSPDGSYIVTANEGEPDDDYTNDPVGSVSIIYVANNFAVKTLDFSAFEGAKAALMEKGFRVFGPNATLAKDAEPEYLTISSDSRKAWVTLQENNAVAEVDLKWGTVLQILPLGVKDISLPKNAFDVSDEDEKIQLGTWPIKAFYLPDAIAYFKANGNGYLALANEGDTRAYDGFDEEVRVEDLTLDPMKFPNAAALQAEDQLGRLIVTSANGNTDNDEEYEELYTPGGRSVTILDATTGKLVAEIGRDLEEQVIAAGNYDDGRSDNKGVEVEAVTIGKMNRQTIAFIGMERSDMIAVYDVSNPWHPKFLQLFETGDAPEGVLFVQPKDSPNGRTLLVVASEEDGMVKLYQPDKL